MGSPGSSQAWGFAVELGKISLLTDNVPLQGILGLSLVPVCNFALFPLL